MALPKYPSKFWWLVVPFVIFIILFTLAVKINSPDVSTSLFLYGALSWLITAIVWIALSVSIPKERAKVLLKRSQSEIGGEILGDVKYPATLTHVGEREGYRYTIQMSQEKHLFTVLIFRIKTGEFRYTASKFLWRWRKTKNVGFGNLIDFFEASGASLYENSAVTKIAIGPEAVVITFDYRRASPSQLPDCVKVGVAATRELDGATPGIKRATPDLTMLKVGAEIRSKAIRRGLYIGPAIVVLLILARIILNVAGSGLPTTTLWAEEARSDIWVGSPSWHPSGRAIAFTDHYGISVAEELPNNTVQIGKFQLGDFPAWSPSGDRLAYCTPEGTWIGTPKGALTDIPNYLRETVSIFGCPIWISNGELLFGVGGGVLKAYLNSSSGPYLRSPTDSSTGYSKSLAWTEAGKKLAFTWVSNGTSDLYINDATGNNRKLVDWPSDEDNPNWSPDGNKIAFESNRTGYPAIWVTDLSTNQSRELVPMAFNPQWNPKYDWIAYRTDTGNLMLINSVSLTKKKLAEGVFPFTWSRDGQRLAFVGYGNLRVWNLSS